MFFYTLYCRKNFQTCLLKLLLDGEPQLTRHFIGIDMQLGGRTNSQE